MLTVSGKVLGASGCPLAGATVMITKASVRFSEIAAISSDAGLFEFGALLPGEYTFSAFSDQGQGTTQVTLDRSRDIVIEVLHAMHD